MGKSELKVKKRLRKQNIRRAVLSTIAAAGILTVAVVAPNALHMLDLVPRQRERYASRVSRSLKTLIDRGFVVTEIHKGEKIIRLSQKGEAFLVRLAAGEYLLQKPRRWDEKWRIIIFDIPERRRGVRDNLRLMLRSIGFFRLQESVWVYPYDCEEVIRLLKIDLTIGRELLYIIAEEVEGDKLLRKRFHLSS